MIIQTYAETRSEPASGTSTNEAYCKLCGQLYDVDDEAGDSEGCCWDHETCDADGCFESAHPKSDHDLCAWHQLAVEEQYLKDVIAGEVPGGMYIPAKHSVSMWKFYVSQLGLH